MENGAFAHPLLDASSAQVSYVLDTEDLFCRKKKRVSSGGSLPSQERASSLHAIKVERFHHFLSSS